MSAQTTRETAAAPIWSGWQTAIISGVYPLQRLLHGSEHSAVFLTERTGDPVTPAALKIIPVERVTLSQLAHWRLVTGLFHPHLIRLFDAGLCQLGGRQFLFVVMEYADQCLADVLKQRPLTPDEVREMLPPTLEALTFLHHQDLVHGQLKPSNILVVGDQVKLASDGIRPNGAPRADIAEISAYDPPQANHLPYSPADDMWGLGITLVEALTQRLPHPAEQSDLSSLPPETPPALSDLVRRCLRDDPAARPRLEDPPAQPGGVPEAPPLPAPAMVEPEPEALPPAASVSKPRWLLPALAVIGGLIALIAVWPALHPPRPAPDSPPPISSPPSATEPPLAAQNAAGPPVATAPAVVHQQLPKIPPKALRTIHGRFVIAVGVFVDHSGAVTGTFLKSPGPSVYFARLARQAAIQWRFVPASEPKNRAWLLRFEFTHSGVTANATPVVALP